MKNCVLILLLLSSPFGGWGANDIAFYNLYANYLQAMTEEGEMFTPDDSTALLSMANLCPIEYGASVYKARALYNSIYGRVVIYEDCNTSGMGERFAANSQNENSTIKQTDDWQIKIYPNPAQDRITLLNSNANEVLNISITDLTGRVITKQKVKTENFVVDINLSLHNGAYMFTVTNSENKTTVKKLLIAK